MANEPKTPTNGPGSPVAKRGDGPLPPATIPDLEATMKSQMVTVTPKDFYRVGWDPDTRQDVKAPNARVLQKWANDNNGRPINTKILESASDETGCKVTVRGWIGDEGRPIVVHEESMIMRWSYELEFLLTEAVAKGIKVDRMVNGVYKKTDVFPPFDVTKPDGNGVSRIVLRDPKHQLHVLAQWVRMKRFGLRASTTKCESRIFRKLLGAEWRDPEEIALEESDIAAVADEQGITPTPETTQISPPNMERLIPEAKKQEQAKAGAKVSPMAVKSLTTRFKDLGNSFPLPPNTTHESFLLAAAIGAMTEKNETITEAKLEVMSPECSGRLWTMIDRVAHNDEESLQKLDALYGVGIKIVETLNKRGPS